MTDKQFHYYNLIEDLCEWSMDVAARRRAQGRPIPCRVVSILQDEGLGWVTIGPDTGETLRVPLTAKGYVQARQWIEAPDTPKGDS